jgi:hypothetical protein
MWFLLIAFLFPQVSLPFSTSLSHQEPLSISFPPFTLKVTPSVLHSFPQPFQVTLRQQELSREVSFPQQIAT